MTATAASFVHGTSSVPLRFETVGQLLDAAARQWGRHDALIVRHQNIRWSYAELKDRVDAVAAGLVALGLQPGDRLGILAPNCAEWVLTQFATAKAGIILVNINPAYRLSELEFALNKTGCVALVTATSFKGSNYLEMLTALLPESRDCVPGLLRAAKVPNLRWLIRLGEERIAGFLSFDELETRADGRSRERVAALAASLQPDDAINIQFTSGTTGSPKGATLSHFNIVNNGFFVAESLRLSELDRMCIPVPLYHCFGMVMGNLGCVSHGAAMVYPSAGFDPYLSLQAIAQERCTVLYGVPTMFIAQLEHPEFRSVDVTSLRTGIMAGAPCPIEITRRVTTEMHVPEITIAYGMTETSPVSFQSAVDDPLARRVSTVGRVQAHVQVKIVDAAGRVVPRNTPGQLCTRGYSVMKGYWDAPSETREAIDEAGWMQTGDIATIDEEGYCNITGRLKDLVIRGGEKVAPREIEEFLYRHPKVQAVQVFGVPDSRFGEEVCAWIQLRPGHASTEEEMRAFCRGQISHQKVPRYVRFVSEFPMTATGKVQKFVMRERMSEELRLVTEKTA